MHVTPLTVRFDEVDSMGVVHHPRYVIYFEIARTQYMTDLGLPYRDVMESGTHLAVIDVAVRYLRSARYQDELQVTTRCVEAGRTRVTMRYEVRRGAELLATGSTRLASVSPAGRPVRMPGHLRELFTSVLELDAEEAAAIERPTGE